MVGFENFKLLVPSLLTFAVLFDVTSSDTNPYYPEFVLQILEANFLPLLLLHVVEHSYFVGSRLIAGFD
jgi:hypothetical protein